MDSSVINPHIISCEGHSLKPFPFLVPQRLNLCDLYSSYSLCTLMVVGITANYNEPCTLLGPARIDSSLRPAIVFTLPYSGQQIATLNAEQWYNSRCWLFVERQYIIRWWHEHFSDCGDQIRRMSGAGQCVTNGSDEKDTQGFGGETLTFKRRIKSHLPFAGIIRSSPYSPRFQDNG